MSQGQDKNNLRNDNTMEEIEIFLTALENFAKAID